MVQISCLKKRSSAFLNTQIKTTDAVNGLHVTTAMSSWSCFLLRAEVKVGQPVKAPGACPDALMNNFFTTPILQLGMTGGGRGPLSLQTALSSQNTQTADVSFGPTN